MCLPYAAKGSQSPALEAKDRSPETLFSSTEWAANFSQLLFDSSLFFLKLNVVHILCGRGLIFFSLLSAQLGRGIIHFIHFYIFPYKVLLTDLELGNYKREMLMLI